MTLSQEEVMLPVGLPETGADEVYVFPVSFAQQRLWFLHQLEPASAAYNISKALRLAGELDVRIFTRTLKEIVQRHETLRTTFAMVGGQPQQLISEQPPAVRVPVIDLSELPSDQSEREARRLFTTAARRPFNLQQGPLFRVAIVRLSAADCVALFTMHHIVSDAWSVSIFVKEFTSLYCALLANEPSPLEDLPIQYADFAEWQSGYLRGEVLDRQLAYWREQLQGAPPVLELPTDRPRPRAQGDNVWVIPIQIEPELVQALKTLSRAHDVTLFMTLLAAFYVLLFRHSGQSQICVGTPVAGRTRAETESLIGCFVNTLVLRGDLSGNPPFTGLLAHVRETCIGAYAHQDVPFEMLVDALQPVRSLSHSPLFQVMFTLQNAPFETFELPGMETKSTWGEPKTAKFDLRLSLTETVEGLRGVLEYNTDLFDAQTVSRMVEHYRRLLAGLVVDADCRIGLLPLLSESEREQLLVEWNGRAVEYAESLVQLFAQQAVDTPDAVAVVFGDERLSYDELNSWANGIAWRLIGLGVGPDVRVALLLERSPALMASLLGVLKAGGAYVPLDAAYPIERLAFMLDDSGAQVLVTDAQHESLLAGASVLCVDVVERTSTAPNRNVQPENLAYVMYTSGSTGQPKGVMVTHRGLSNYLSWATAHYKVREGCGAVVHSPIGFDLTVTSLFTPLLSGSTVHLLPDDAGIEELADVVRAGRDYSLIKLTPSHLEMLNQLLAPEEIVDRARALIIGGEALRGEVLKVWLEHTPRTRLINEYGPTEAVVGCCEYEVAADAPAGALPIGRPIPNTRAVVLDAQMGLAPVGVVGELYLGGVGLACGYLNRPDLTAASFVPDEQGERLYRTGDVARWNAAALLEYLGRNDQQVKVRGYRIELGEIEAALGQEPRIRECAAVVRERGVGHQQLVAYVVMKEGVAAPVSELRTFLLAKLPEHMVPSLFVPLSELPLTVNGKVDRRALPAPELGQLVSERRAPRNETEATLVRIWGEVLGVAEVGVNDNFFALGGDSILCIQVVARASRVGLRFLPRQLFEHQTVAELAVAITVVADGVVGRGEARCEESRCDETREVPLTPIQRWFFSQELERPQHWNQAVLLATRHKLEAGALARAVRALTLRHEALRLRFRHEAGWKQYLLSLAEWQANSAPAVTVIDLKLMGTLPTVDLESTATAALERAAEAVQRSIDLVVGPLLRVVLFELEGEQRLLLVAHHLVMDGVSWRVLLEELQRAYEQAVAGSEIELGARGSSFVDWAERLTVYAGSAELKAQAGYWETAEAAARKFRLPRYFQQGENREWSQRQVTTRLSVEETRALLQEVPRVYGTQINEVLLTALGRVLSRWTGERRVVVELEGHGRETLGIAELDLSGAVGWFTSMYPVVLEADWGASGEALKAVKEQLRAIPDKGVSYGVWKYLHTDYKEEKDHGGEVSFNYLGQLDQVLSEEGPFGVAKEEAGPRRDEGERRSFQLSVVGSVRGGELVMSWKYSSEVHRAATIERVAVDYESALRELIAHCREVEAGTLTPSDFPLVSMKQQQLDKIISKLGKR